MKSSIKKNNTRKVAIISIALALVVLAGYTVASYTIKLWPFNGSWDSNQTKVSDSPLKNIDSEEPTSEQIEAAAQQKQKSLDQDQTNGTSPPSTFEVIITAANQTANSLQIRVLVDAIIGSGTCSLSLTKGQITVTRVVQTQPSASTSTCQGFDIPMSELTVGDWILKIAVVSGATSGSVTQTVQVE